MQKIPCSRIPDQSLSFDADGNFWELRIYQAIDGMYADITVDGNLLMPSARCVAGDLLIPYDYLWNPSYGNFVFDSEPDWEQFGITCQLIYLSNSEANTFKGFF